VDCVRFGWARDIDKPHTKSRIHTTETGILSSANENGDAGTDHAACSLPFGDIFLAHGFFCFGRVT
jgi:hypothetical protein